MTRKFQVLIVTISHIRYSSKEDELLHVEPLGGLLDRVGDEAAAEVGHAGRVGAPLRRPAAPTTLLPAHKHVKRQHSILSVFGELI